MPSAPELIDLLEKRAGALRGLGYRVAFALTDTRERIVLDATGGALQIAAGDGEADTQLSLSSEDLQRLAAGRLSPLLAFSTGRLKIEGSKGVAMKLASLLDED